MNAERPAIRWERAAGFECTNLKVYLRSSRHRWGATPRATSRRAYFAIAR
jgi:hypothetical protein